ncbi:MAG: ABC transporter substrate-binding protein [Flavobacteriales bacterium]|nr:ABC transporter substrate-binding protein [Flavobacteriales bacterium]
MVSFVIKTIEDTMNKIVHFIPFLLLCNCTESENQQDNSGIVDRDFDVVAHISAEPDGLHPLNSFSLNTVYIFKNLHNTLLKIDLASLELMPDLAAKLPEQIDSNTYKYDIRKDVKWDNGEPLLSEDIRFSLLLALCPLNNAPQKRTSLEAFVDSIEIMDKTSFTYGTNFPYAGANHIWGDLPIISKSFYDPEDVLKELSFYSCKTANYHYSQQIQDWFTSFNSRQYSHNPEFINGLGPYKLTHWEEGQHITIEKKDNWWGKDIQSIYHKANPKKIHYKIIADEQTTSIALLNNEIDVAYALSSAQAHDLATDEHFDKNFNLNLIDVFGITFMAINSRPNGNTGNPVLEDQAVRLAMSYSTPYAEILNSIYNMGSRQVSIVNKHREYYHHDLKMPSLDLKIADSILTSAGWIDRNLDGIRENELNGELLPLSFELGYINNPSFKIMADLIAASFLKIGIRAELKPIQANMMFQKLMSQDYDAFITSISGDGGFEDFSQLLHTSAWEQHAFNFTGFGDEESDLLLDSINKTFDKRNQEELYLRLQEKFNEQGTFIILYSLQRKIAVSKKFINPICYAEKPSILLNALEIAP